MGKKLDHSIDGILPLLIKKAGDKNAFIAEEAEKAIMECCAQGSEVKIVHAACPMMKNKINMIKVKTIFCLNLVLERMKSRILKFRENEALVRTIGKGMSEAAAEVRSISKEGFMILKENLK